jgi:lysyl-tRNA synthetase class 2
VGSRFIQMESLYRFNAKFRPRWEPRYLVYDGRLGLLPTGIAAMRAEGQIALALGCAV